MGAEPKSMPLEVLMLICRAFSGEFVANYYLTVGNFPRISFCLKRSV